MQFHRTARSSFPGAPNEKQRFCSHLKHSNNGLQPTSDDLRPGSDGLQPASECIEHAGRAQVSVMFPSKALCTVSTPCLQRAEQDPQATQMRGAWEGQKSISVQMEQGRTGESPKTTETHDSHMKSFGRKKASHFHSKASAVLPRLAQRLHHL